MAKVSIVKWSPILIPTARSTVSGLTIYFENALKGKLLEILGMPEMVLLAVEIEI